MIYNLIEAWRDTLVQQDVFGLFRVFVYVEFRAVLAIVLSFGLVLLAGRPVIDLLWRAKMQDQPEFDHEMINQLMAAKRGTPTMGGVLISGAILLSTLLLADLGSFYVVMALTCLIWLSLLGGVDDYLKLTKHLRSGSRDGLRRWEKILLQVGLALVLGLFTYHYGQSRFASDAPALSQMAACLNLPFSKSWVPGDMPGAWVPAPDLIVLSMWPFAALTVLTLVGASNALNLTDGLAGLASGVMVVVALAFLVLALIAGYVHPNMDYAFAQYLLVPYIPESEELAVVAGAMVGACLGFLWYNANPAQVFMGDTGSLPLGGLIGYIAIVTRQELLLVVIGGVFVLETLSVILQVGSCKLRNGRRLFKMTPIHHHFQMCGWTETQIVTRSWVLTVMLAALALATIKIR